MYSKSATYKLIFDLFFSATANPGLHADIIFEDTLSMYEYMCWDRSESVRLLFGSFTWIHLFWNKVLCSLSEQNLWSAVCVTNQRVWERKKAEWQNSLRKEKGRCQTDHSVVRLRLIRFVLIKAHWLAQKVYDEMGHILVTTVMPVEALRHRGLW